MLARRSKSLKDIVAVLQVYHQNLGDEEDIVLDASDEPAPSQRMILEQLIAFLDAC